jgi:hypothetical protein
VQVELFNGTGNVTSFSSTSLLQTVIPLGWFVGCAVSFGLLIILSALLLVYAFRKGLVFDWKRSLLIGGVTLKTLFGLAFVMCNFLAPSQMFADFLVRLRVEFALFMSYLLLNGLEMLLLVLFWGGAVHHHAGSSRSEMRVFRGLIALCAVLLFVIFLGGVIFSAIVSTNSLQSISSWLNTLSLLQIVVGLVLLCYIVAMARILLQEKKQQFLVWVTIIGGVLLCLTCMINFIIFWLAQEISGAVALDVIFGLAFFLPITLSAIVLLVLTFLGAWMADTVRPLPRC